MDNRQTSTSVQRGGASPNQKDDSSRKSTKAMDRKKTLLVCFAVLVAGAVVTTLIFATEPTASRSGAVKETAMLVNVIGVERGTYQPTIKAMGTVEPSQDIILSPRVSGQVVSRSPSFTPGGYVRRGEPLLQIDPSDYENTLRQRESALSQAISDLNIEMGRQSVAKQDYQLLDDTLSGENRSLVLREPQLEAARSRVDAARSAVNQAELDLQRTAIRAPFDAHILSRNVNVGSQVAPGDNLGRLVGLDTYWVEATVPQSKLRWLTIPQNSAGSEVLIRNRTAWEDGQYRRGRIFKLIGALEDQTRMARLLISVPDPQAYLAENSNLPPLMIGSFVEASIQAEQLADVVRLNRDYVRDDDTVWIMDDGRLRIRGVDIVMQDADYAYIRSGLEAGDQVVTTNLSTVSEGARLRVEVSDIESGQEDLPSTSQGR